MELVVVDGLRCKRRGRRAMEGREVRGAFAPVQDCRAGNGNGSPGICFFFWGPHVTCADQICSRGRETGSLGGSVLVGSRGPSIMSASNCQNGLFFLKASQSGLQNSNPSRLMSHWTPAYILLKKKS